MKLELKNYLKLEGELISLSRINQYDVEEYAKLFLDNSVETLILTSSSQLLNIESVVSYIEDIINDDSRIDFLIREIKGESIVGEVVINEIDYTANTGKLRVSLFNSDDYGKHYDTEAIQLALYYAFGTNKLHRVELEVLSSNKRAVKAYKSLGFVQEGVKRDASYFNHEYHDLIIMSVLENEFRESHSKELKQLEEFMDLEP